MRNREGQSLLVRAHGRIGNSLHLLREAIADKSAATGGQCRGDRGLVEDCALGSAHGHRRILQLALSRCVEAHTTRCAGGIRVLARRIPAVGSGLAPESAGSLPAIGVLLTEVNILRVGRENGASNDSGLALSDSEFRLRGREACVAILISFAQAAEVRGCLVVPRTVTGSDEFNDRSVAFRQTVREGQRPDITRCIGLGCVGDDIPIKLACQCAEGLTLHELINRGVLNLGAQVTDQTDIGHVVGKIHREGCTGEDPKFGTDRDAPVLDIAHRVEPVVVLEHGLAAVVGVDGLHEAGR